MKWIIRIYSLILLAYTGWRTFDFISSTLPKNDISFWLSLAFLFATEAGLVLWHEANLNHVTTQNQEYISKAMTWIDFVGSLSAGIADMILRQTFIEGYVIPPALAQFLMYGLPAIMAFNVGSVIMFEQADAETQESKAEKSLKFEIHRQAMKDLRADREVIADEKKAMIYGRMRANVTGRIDRKYGQPTELPTRKPRNDAPRQNPIIQLLNRGREAITQYNQEAPTAQTAEALDQSIRGDEPKPIINENPANPTNQRKV